MSRKEEKREKFAHGVCHESLHLGAALGAILHVISTSLLGITAITMANTIAGEETVYKLASMLLVVLGGGYVILFLNGKGGHSHSHNQPMEKMVVAGLILVPAFCLLVLRRFRLRDRAQQNYSPSWSLIFLIAPCWLATLASIWSKVWRLISFKIWKRNGTRNVSDF
nr:uncharacterized protein LOC112801987 isoform X1 [Arachis hypogaea]